MTIVAPAAWCRGACAPTRHILYYSIIVLDTIYNTSIYPIYYNTSIPGYYIS